ncbi:MAG: hypothetical protein ACFCU8_16725 [Thermosynechococcaceae cyanobacterium]
MATQLESGRLQGIRISSDSQDQHRLLSRTRSQLVSRRTRLNHQIRMESPST